MSASIRESTVEEAALDWFEELGYAIRHGPEIAPDEPGAERSGYDEVVLGRRLRDAIADLNEGIPDETQEEAFRKVLRPESPSLVANNRSFHRMLVDGVPVEYQRSDGSLAGDRAKPRTSTQPGAD